MGLIFDRHFYCVHCEETDSGNDTRKISMIKQAFVDFPPTASYS